MCLITAAPKGVLKTTDALASFVENGMHTNTDGSGFAAKKKNQLILEKGFRDSKSLLAAIAKHKLTKSDELIIHHRIGTSGRKNDVNMHPFVVSDNVELLRSVKGSFNLPIMAHNGVFSSFTDNQSEYSDTYHFIEKFMSIPEVLSLFNRDLNKFKEVFKSQLGWAKLAFLLPEKDLTIIGDFTEDAGYFHSNGGYKSYVHDRGGSSAFRHHTRGTFYGGSHGYGDYDDYGNYIGDEGERGYPRRPVVNEVIKPMSCPLHLQLPAGNNLSAEGVVKKKNICFLHSDIKITELNYHHFILIPVVDFSSTIEEDKGYTIENYEEKTLMNPVVPVNGVKVLEWVNVPRLWTYCNIYVKSQYESQYDALRKLLDTTARQPSKSMIKKIRKALSKNSTKVSLNFKDYGYIRWFDLNHFYNTYKGLYEKITRDEDESLVVLNAGPVKNLNQMLAEVEGVSQLEV